MKSQINYEGGNGNDPDDCFDDEDEQPVDTDQGSKNPTESDPDTVGWEDPEEKKISKNNQGD